MPQVTSCGEISVCDRGLLKSSQTGSPQQAPAGIEGEIDSGEIKFNMTPIFLWMQHDLAGISKIF